MRVRTTSDGLGAFLEENADGIRFDRDIPAGTVGEITGPWHRDELAAQGWERLDCEVRGERLVVPVHGTMYEPID